jgi:hypothetical protein
VPDCPEISVMETLCDRMVSNSFISKGLQLTARRAR